MQGGAGAADVPSARGLRVALIVSRFNADVTERLVDGARDLVIEAGISPQGIERIDVPGAFEIPLAAAAAARSGRFDALVCLGCLIRGATPHFEYIAAAASQALMRLSTEAGVPIGFGVLTTNTRAEADERAVAGPDNKGREAALAAIEMVHVLRSMARRATPAVRA